MSFSLDEWLDYFVPLVCRRCESEGHTWCGYPDSPFPWPRCFWCRGNYHPGVARGGCQRSLPLVTIGPYVDQALAATIQDWKYQGFWRLSDDWGRLLAQSMRQHFGRERGDLVPIALHWTRKLSRGYNQATILARTIGGQLSWPVTEVLIRSKRQVPQATLPFASRAKNVEGIFRLRAVSPRSVWIVDDVVTSGATVQAALRALEREQWTVQGVIAIAYA